MVSLQLSEKVAREALRVKKEKGRLPFFVVVENEEFSLLSMLNTRAIGALHMMHC